MIGAVASGACGYFNGYIQVISVSHILLLSGKCVKVVILWFGLLKYQFWCLVLGRNGRSGKGRSIAAVAQADRTPVVGDNNWVKLDAVENKERSQNGTSEFANSTCFFRRSGGK